MLIDNITPTLTIGGDSTAVVGTPYTLNLSSVDPGADTIQFWDINWGDGSDPDQDGSIGQRVSGNPATVQHTYTEAHPDAAIVAAATDEDGDWVAYDAKSVAATAALAAATRLRPDALDGSDVRLDWFDNSARESGYRIQISTDGTNFTTAATTGPDATAAMLTDLQPDQTYTVRVDTLNDQDVAATSATSSVTTLATNSSGWYSVTLTPGSIGETIASWRGSGDQLHATTNLVYANSWRSAVFQTVSGTATIGVTNSTTNQSLTLTYTFANETGPFRVNVASALGNISGNSLASSGVSANQQLIVLEDSYSAPSPNDTDYDDFYWKVTAAKVSVQSMTLQDDVSGNSATADTDATGTFTTTTDSGGNSTLHLSAVVSPNTTDAWSHVRYQILDENGAVIDEGTLPQEGVDLTFAAGAYTVNTGTDTPNGGFQRSRSIALQAIKVTANDASISFSTGVGKDPQNVNSSDKQAHIWKIKKVTPIAGGGAAIDIKITNNTLGGLGNTTVEYTYQGPGPVPPVRTYQVDIVADNAPNLTGTLTVTVK